MRSTQQHDGSGTGKRREQQQLRLQFLPSVTGRRRDLRQMFSRDSFIGRRRTEVVEPSLDIPTTPRLVLGLHNFSSIRLAIPYLNLPSVSLPNSPVAENLPPAPTSLRSSQALRHSSQSSARTLATPATTLDSQTRIRQGSPRRDDIDVYLADAPSAEAEAAAAGRSRRKGRSKKSKRQCGPKFRNKRVRVKSLACVIWGLVLVLVLTIYLALALTNRQQRQEFHVLLILIILITTIFFCHALIRLCMLLLHPPREDDDMEQQRLPAMIGPGEYADPVVPIRVLLARDEEAVGIESLATKIPPPVYGFWRGSVRVDPNLLYWQRNEVAAQSRALEDRPNTATRPPSYISEDGVSYAVEAVPRSIAPTSIVPLPVHPSERGRLPQRSSSGL